MNKLFVKTLKWDIIMNIYGKYITKYLGVSLIEKSGAKLFNKKMQKWENFIYLNKHKIKELWLRKEIFYRRRIIYGRKKGIFLWYMEKKKKKGLYWKRFREKRKKKVESIKEEFHLWWKEKKKKERNFYKIWSNESKQEELIKDYQLYQWERNKKRKRDIERGMIPVYGWKKRKKWMKGSRKKLIWKANRKRNMILLLVRKRIYWRKWKKRESF